MSLLPGLVCLLMAGTVLPASAASSADRRRAKVEAFVAKADALINDRNYDVKSTPHYKVKTDDPRLDVAEAARILESFHGWFDSFWKGRAELLPDDTPSRVYLFYSRAKFKELGVYEQRPDNLEIVGHYQEYFDVVALHTDTVRPEMFADLLLHEAAHQLVHRRLYGTGKTPSLWVTEGLADYFGFTMGDGAGGFDTGRIGNKEVVLFKGAPRSGRRLAWPQAKEYRRAMARGETLPLDTVLRTNDPGVFYDTRALERYTASWLLAHYLLHGDGGAHTPAFVAYMKHDAAGESGADILYRDLGLTREQLDAAFKSYVSELKAK